MRALIWLFLTSAATTSLVSCVKTNAFKCDGDSTACSGTGARCEADGFCSIESGNCPSGHEYSDTAGDLAGQCVGGGPTPDGPQPDGPSDGPPSDGPQDAPVGCPGDFAAIAVGGQTGHKYKFISVTADWVSQHNTVCVGQGSYLAIPNDAGELAAIFGLALSADVWVGVSDRTTEGSFLDVLNTAYTALPLNGNKVMDDCAQTANGTSLDVIGCSSSRVAVCECEE